MPPPAAVHTGTLVDLLRSRAAGNGAATSHRFLRDGLEVTAALTYGELDRRARAGAVALRPHVSAGDRVLLVYPPGLEFLVGFFAALYAGAIPVPAAPTRPQQSDARLAAIAADAQPAVAATTADMVHRFAGRLDLGAAVPPLPCLSPDAAPDAAADEWQSVPAGAGPIAHLQYTSGSTALPKGVMITHANVLSNMADLHRGWRHDSDSTIVSWLPPFHDMGLVYGLLTPVYASIPCVLMPPVVFLQRPLRWLQAITRFRGTHAAAPNFAYDHCVRRIRSDDRAVLDLSGWRVAVNGAEPVRPETMDRFCEAFAAAGFDRRAFAPGYGLAEATLKVTAAGCGDGPTVATFGDRTLVGCGAPLLDTRLAIVHPETGQRLPAGETGEIWVGGSSVAAGYWQRPEASAETFAARTGDGDGPFLRTGDLGFFALGQLFVTGRLKDLLIIRGQNYYPQDIEAAAEASGARLRAGSCAAFSVERDGEERLVVACEVDRGVAAADGPEQIELVRAAITREHELRAEDVVLLAIGGAPKTSSGKIQRQACRSAYQAGTLLRWQGAAAARADGTEEAS